MDLIDSPHINLRPPFNSPFFFVRGTLKYYHYTCDGFDDKGWGCGYRTLQTIFSWIKLQQEMVPESNSNSTFVPSILDIQKALVDIADKGESFIGSNEWIGSIEVAYCIEHFFKVQSRIIHLRSIYELKGHTKDIINHFTEFGSPIMMGGDADCSSKCILGISVYDEQISLLILDPHYSGPTTSREELQSKGWIQWQHLDSFNHSSFYNLCCPLIKAKD